jgi:hypothetical protein
MNRFEVGKEYSCRSVCDYDCQWTFMVVKRTEQTVTIKRKGTLNDKPTRHKITLGFDGECIHPLGNYSMAPVLRAS